MSAQLLTRDEVRQAAGKLYIVPVATACNAACVFCATTTYAPPTNPEMAAVERLLASAGVVAQLGVNRFEITGGGEPSLHPSLGLLVRELRRRYPESRIKIYTNGSRVGQYLRYVDDVVISRCAVDPAENQELMRIAGGSPGLSLLVDSIRAITDARVRLSVPLLRGGIDSADRAVSMARQCMGLVDGLVLRPLYPATPGLDALDPRIDLSLLRKSLESAGFDDDYVEIDQWGCFRARSIILGADGKLYGDWRMTERYYVV